MFEGMLDAVEDSLSDLAISDEEQDGEDHCDDDNATEFGKLSDDDEPCWVMGKIPKAVQHCVVGFRQKQMRYNKLTKPGWWDEENYICESDMNMGLLN
jgi:hypothetical protein